MSSLNRFSVGMSRHTGSYMKLTK